MASWELYDERLNFQVDDVDEQRTTDHYQHHHQIHGISRLATCSSSTIECDINLEDDEINDDGLPTMLSQLSIGSIDFNGDADDEEMSSDDEIDKKSAPAAETYHSLPGTPIQHWRDNNSTGLLLYSSENETKKKSRKNDDHRRRRGGKKSVSKREVNNKKLVESDRRSSFSGESDHSGGLKVITRPKGGEHSLSMDMEEVKACRDLGFDLEMDMKMMPSNLTISVPPVLDTGTGGATTSSGGSSPMSNWRISSPGDEPKDVKARLKVWAQAVALASTSPRSGGSS